LGDGQDAVRHPATGSSNEFVEIFFLGFRVVMYSAASERAAVETPGEIIMLCNRWSRNVVRLVMLAAWGLTFAAISGLPSLWAQNPQTQGPPGQYPPGQYPPGQYPPGQYPPNQYPTRLPGGIPVNLPVPDVKLPKRQTKNEKSGDSLKVTFASVDGTLRKVGEKDLLLQTSKKNLLRFRLLPKTQFRDKEGQPIRDSLLHPGDQLQTADGATAEVTTVQPYNQTETTYDLTIDGLHTYYVDAGATAVLVHNCGPDNQTFATRAEAKAAAYDRAGVAPGTEPDAVWTVGDDVKQRGMPGYRYDPNPGAHGTYEQFETENGSRVIAEHTNDPNAPFSHFHAGQPKVNPARDGVNLGWDMTTEFERYSPVGGAHHLYYESNG